MKDILKTEWVEKIKKKITSLPNLAWGIWFLDPPEDISLDGYRIDNVIQYTDTIITIYFGIVVAALVYFIFKYRSRPGHKAVYDRGDTKKHIAITAAMGLLVFLSIDVVIGTISFKDLKEAFWKFPKGKEVIRIEVMSQQFVWNFRYSGPDGEFNTDDDLIPTQNHMHIPVNTPIVIQIAAWDVIHSFYLPNFRIKIDATPGMTNTMWFQAVKVGNYEIACAELCGNSHYRMRGFLTVESKEDFNNWLEELRVEAEEEEDWDEWEEIPSEEIKIPENWGWVWKKGK